MLRKTILFFINLFMLTLTIFVSIAVCVGCVFAFDYLNSEGVFSRWVTLSNPPGELSEILSADYATIWVKTEKNAVYSLNVLCWLQTTECEEMVWMETNIELESLPTQANGEFGYYLVRQDNCLFHDGFGQKYFQEPNGNIIECLKTFTLYPEVFVVTYYARSSDNTIQYWHVYSSSNTLFQQLFAVVPIGLILGIVSFTFIQSKLNSRNKNHLNS